MVNHHFPGVFKNLFSRALLKSYLTLKSVNVSGKHRLCGSVKSHRVLVIC